MESERIAISCFLCGEACDVLQTKHGKPYVVCNPCGVQLFVRRREGIDRFFAFVRAFGIPAAQAKQGLAKIATARALLAQRDRLCSELKELGDGEGILGFGSDEATKAAAKILRTEILAISKRLRALPSSRV